MVETSRGFVRYRSAETFEASAYTMAGRQRHGAYFTGVVPYHGVVAVDPDVIPLMGPGCTSPVTALR